MLKKAVALAVFLLLPDGAMAGTTTSVDQAITDNLGDPAGFRAAFDAIKAAVEKDDAAALAAWVAFPITVRMGDKAVLLANADAFTAAYPQLFTPAIKAAITGQSYADLFVNYQGAMFGNGQLWVSGICKTDACETVDWRIITIQDAAK